MPYKDPEKQKAAQRKYYEDNKTLYATRNKIKRTKIRQYIMDIKESTPCADCGMKYPYYVMQFDHLPEHIKGFNLSNLSATMSVEAVEKEIAKCQVVCANCHAHRTWARSTGFISTDAL